MNQCRIIILLAALGLTAACQQAGQALSPATYSAGNPKGPDKGSGEETVSRTEEISPIAPKSDPGEVGEPQAVAAAREIPLYDNRSGTEIDLRDGDSSRFARLDPIEPKSDAGRVDIIPFDDARIHYGTDFAEILPKTPSVVMFLPLKGEPLPLRYALEIGFRKRAENLDGTHDMRWDTPPQPEEGTHGLVVRLIYTPAGKTAGPPFYTDAVWIDPTENDGANISFPDISPGPGHIEFFVYRISHMDASGKRVYGLPPDFHTGNLVPLTDGDASNPFPATTAGVLSLGSFFTTFRIDFKLY